MRVQTDEGTPILCPLSGSEDLRILETIDYGDLVNLYYAGLGIDIRPMYPPLSKMYLMQSAVSDLLFFFPRIPGPAEFYDALSRKDWYHDPERSEFDHVVASIQPGERVLDVGCGTGAFAERLSGVSYRGLEFNPRAVEECLARGLDVARRSIEEEAAENAGAYDVVCAFQVLEHVSDVAGFIGACVRALRPGGRLVFSVPSADSFLRHNTNDILNLPPHHLTWWTDRCLEWLGTRYSLRLTALRHSTLTDDKDHTLYLKVLLGGALYKNRYGKEPGLINLSREYLGLRPEIQELCLAYRTGFLSPAMEPRGKTVIADYRLANG